MVKAREGRPRAPGVLFASLLVVLLTAIGVFALTNRQPPPPSIAEFAPQAIQQIKETQSNQTFGGGLGTSAAPPPPAPPGSAGEEIDVSRVRRCVGSPPRQTEDPQSPPCVAYWKGNNGGATTKGVTKDEIRIAVLHHTPGNPYYRGLERHFNKRYEFYGRSMRFMGYKPADHFASCAVHQSVAAKVDEELQVFASINYGTARGNEHCYYHELSRRKVISTQASFMGTPAATLDDLDEYAPYEWNYFAALDQILEGVSGLVCSQLAGKPPSYAGPSEIAKPTRVFGVFIDTSVTIDYSRLAETSGRCGVKWVEVPVNVGNTSGDAATEMYRNAILKFRSQGVTTVMCLCWFGHLGRGALMTAATNDEYYPEWITQNYQKQDDDQTVITALEGSQAPYLLGLRTWSKSVAREDRPSWYFVKEESPEHQAQAQNFSPDYWNLILLASGIQMAGPNLTPQSFERGLFNTKFPNPSCGGPPYYQACVGFEGGRHTMTKDFALVWWDATQGSLEYESRYETNEFYRNTNAPRGAYCYVRKGERFGASAWQKMEPEFKQGDCR